MAEERLTAAQDEKKMSAASGHGDDSSLNSNNCNQTETKEEDAQISGNPASSSSSDEINMNKGKSCKGCLYYSSTLKSNSRKPLRVGISRSLPHVSNYSLQ